MIEGRMCFQWLKKLLSDEPAVLGPVPPPERVEPTPAPVPDGSHIELIDEPVREPVPEPVEASITEPNEEPTMVISSEQKRVCQSIVSVFETGDPLGNYAAAVVLPDGAGISYGKHQATDKGGNLDAIVMRYIDLGGIHSEQLRAFLPQLDRNETAGVDPKNLPAWVVKLLDLLKTAASDPIMRIAQDQVFDEEYWQPCAQQCKVMKLEHALSWAIVYDTCIHSGPGGVARIRRKFAASPPSGGGDEKAWAEAYLNARRNWLANYGEPGHIVRRTVVRMDTLHAILDDGNWELNTPISIGHPYRVEVK